MSDDNDINLFGDDPRVNELREVEERIKPLLAGRPPEFQGALLADLIAMWFAGHAPAVREERFDNLIELIRKLIPINEMLMFGPDGHPAKEEKHVKQSTH